MYVSLCICIEAGISWGAVRILLELTADKKEVLAGGVTMKCNALDKLPGQELSTPKGLFGRRNKENTTAETTAAAPHTGSKGAILFDQC
jgi:hypothetical protein